MNISNNLFIVIFALLPIILYVYLVYYMIPKTYVSLDRGRRYLISGLMSPFIVFLVYFIFAVLGASGLFRILSSPFHPLGSLLYISIGLSLAISHSSYLRGLFIRSFSRDTLKLLYEKSTRHGHFISIVS
jgi:hypothetical protein